jgi:hypothetical protein
MHSALEIGLFLCIHLRFSNFSNAAAVSNSPLSSISAKVQEVYTIIVKRLC